MRPSRGKVGKSRLRLRRVLNARPRVRWDRGADIRLGGKKVTSGLERPSGWVEGKTRREKSGQAENSEEAMESVR